MKLLSYETKYHKQMNFNLCVFSYDNCMTGKSSITLGDNIPLDSDSNTRRSYMFQYRKARS